MIEVTHLSKDYGPHRAISDLSFQVTKRDVVGLLGPNGAGKSTTMKIITGFMAPTSGVARVAGFDVFEAPLEVKKRIGYLPEAPPIYGDMYVRDYLEYVADLKQVPSSRKKQGVDAAIEKTHLGDVQGRLIQNLSKGFRQRVGIAQALVSDPEVLVLDEPTVGLDPKQVAEIRDLIKALKGQHTIILSTHILSEVQATCENVIIINKGRIVLQDSIEHLAHMEKGRNRLHIRLRNSAPTLATELQQIGSFVTSHLGSSDKEWSLDVAGDEIAVAKVAEFLALSKYGLLEFTPQKLDLEDVFIKATYGANKNGEV